jgi:2-methylcitrate dehydratase PrpD
MALINALRLESAQAFRSMVDWAAQVSAVPGVVQRRAAIVLMDDLGAMLAGAREPEVGRVRAQLTARSVTAECTVYHPGAPRLDRNAAALANGMAATWCELDEGFRRAPCHAGAYILPALLAEAELLGRSTAELLRALATAYEITTRLACAFPFATLTVHPHAAFGPVGAAAAVSAIRGHDAATMLAAVSGALTMTFAGPFKHAMDGALVRNAWTAAGAEIGLRAADWAECGIGGQAETPFDVFVTCFGSDAVPVAMTDKLGVEWGLSDGYHKVFACCQYAHSTVEATLALHRRLAGQAADEIEQIIVETHPLGESLGRGEPATTLAAKFSMVHAAAAAAHLGTGGQAAFSAGTLHDPTIAALRARVRVEPFVPAQPPPHDRPARVTWQLASGERWTETCLSARGGPDQPFDETVLANKFTENAAGAFPRMLPLLQAIIEADAAILARPWSSVAAELVA